MFLTALLAALLSQQPQHGNTKGALAHVNAVYVDSLGSDQAAALARERLIGALSTRPTFRLVNSRELADAVLSGTATISEGSKSRVDVWHSETVTKPTLVAQLGVHLTDIRGTVLWGFDQTACKKDAEACVADQLSKAIEKDRKQKR